MTNIVKFPASEDDKFSYFETEIGLGIQSRHEDVKITRAGYMPNIPLPNSFVLYLENPSAVPHNRDDLAAFLWAAAAFLDSEERYRPNVDLVGLDYEQPT